MIRNAPLFNGVAACDLETALIGARLEEYRDGAMIAARGDEATHAYLIAEGLVWIGTLGEGGKRVTVEIFGPLQVFGEIGAVDGQPRTADAIAMGVAKLLAIPAASFRNLLQKSPIFALNLVRTVTVRLRRTYSLFEDASLSDLEHRFARQVVYLAGLGASGGRHVRLYSRMRQQDLADLLGATPRSIITILNKWRSEGLVEFDGRTAQLTILDMDRFTSLSTERVSAPRG